MEQDLTPYTEVYSDESFRAKIRDFALKAGRAVVEKALTLYYCLRDPDTPKWAKGVITGSLGYFILPLDAIPDFIPLAGFSDDLGALAVALGVVAFHIKKEHSEKAGRLLTRIFGGRQESEAV